MKTKKVIRSVAFVLIFAALFSLASAVMKPKWADGNRETISAEEFYNLPKNSVELLFLGSSQMVSGVNTACAYLDYGISSYSLAGSNYPPLVNYYWLREAYKTQKNLKLVILDTSMFYETVEDTVRYRKGLDSMHFSLNKLSAIYDRCKDEGMDAFPTYLFNLINYHSRWEELTAQDVTLQYDNKKIYNGSRIMGDVWVPDVPFDEFATDNDVIGDVEESHKANERQIDFGKKIIEFCRDKEINIALIKTPKLNWTGTGSDGVRKIAEEYSIEFLDFSNKQGMKNIGFDYYNDMYDEEHLNIRGCTKLTKYLCDYFSDKIDFTDYRNDSTYVFNKLDDYNDNYVDNMMKSSVDALEFLSYLDNPMFDILISSTADISSLWTPAMAEEFKKLGIKADISDLSGKNYIFVIHEGKCVYEEVSEDDISYKGEFSNGRKLKVKATDTASAKSVYATVGSAKKYPGVLGMNFYIFNNVKGMYSATISIAEKDGILCAARRPQSED